MQKCFAERFVHCKKPQQNPGANSLRSCPLFCSRTSLCVKNFLCVREKRSILPANPKDKTKKENFLPDSSDESSLFGLGHLRQPFLAFRFKKSPQTRISTGVFCGFAADILFCCPCLARPGGFEPPASRIGICCDIQLRYGRSHLRWAHCELTSHLERGKPARTCVMPHTRVAIIPQRR